jgi:hypothetical protein
MTDRINFSFITSCLQCNRYWVFGDGPFYCVTLRLAAEPSERLAFPRDEAAWQREVVSQIGLLWREANDEPISQRVVDAFNRWRAKYPSLAGPGLSAPQASGAEPGEARSHALAIVRGGRYVADLGWIPIDQDATRDSRSGG